MSSAHMKEYCYESPFELEIKSVTVNARPRVVKVIVEHQGNIATFTFGNPSPIASLAGLFEELDRIRIADRNLFGSQLDFGRYDVQIWDEDNPFACFDCDDYSVDGLDD
ncbi:hypothetical protein SH528x_007337 [Novipirellula sp. SH528]|uniref:hypothetical protein n=1 Tax=Novipirellula sp. SH528 TaxID=3454466 RepID=UPI003F9FE57C